MKVKIQLNLCPEVHGNSGNHGTFFENVPKLSQLHSLWYYTHLTVFKELADDSICFCTFI